MKKLIRATHTSNIKSNTFTPCLQLHHFLMMESKNLSNNTILSTRRSKEITFQCNVAYDVMSNCRILISMNLCSCVHSSQTRLLGMSSRLTRKLMKITSDVGAFFRCPFSQHIHSTTVNKL